MTIVNNTKELGVSIRRERKRQKLTQIQLAALSGVGIRFLRELEHGKATCHIGLAFSVLQTLGISVTINNRSE